LAKNPLQQNKSVSSERKQGRQAVKAGRLTMQTGCQFRQAGKADRLTRQTADKADRLTRQTG
jgi:hypothetical protein